MGYDEIMDEIRVAYRTGGLKHQQRRAALIKRIAERDGWNCTFCKQPLGLDITINHKKKRGDGGDDTLPNLDLAHKRCNTSEGNKRKNTAKCVRCGMDKNTMLGSLCTTCRELSRNSRSRGQTTTSVFFDNIVARATPSYAPSALVPIAEAPRISDLCEAGMHELCVMPACACTCHGRPLNESS